MYVVIYRLMCDLKSQLVIIPRLSVWVPFSRRVCSFRPTAYVRWAWLARTHPFNVIMSDECVDYGVILAIARQRQMSWNGREQASKKVEYKRLNKCQNSGLNERIKWNNLCSIWTLINFAIQPFHVWWSAKCHTDWTWNWSMAHINKTWSNRCHRYTLICIVCWTHIFSVLFLYLRMSSAPG